MNFFFAKRLTSRSGNILPTHGALGTAAVLLSAAVLAACAAQAETPQASATQSGKYAQNAGPASAASAPAAGSAPGTADDDDGDAASVAATADQAPADKDLPRLALSSQVVYQVLAAEIALQRGLPAPAYQTWLALARSTRDPRAAKRAAEIAVHVQSPADALAAAQLWREYAPDDAQAAQLDASLLVIGGKVTDAEPLLAQQLAKTNGDQRGEAILALQLLISRGSDRIGGLHVLQDLLKNDLKRPEAQVAIARQQINADDRPGARQSLHTALQLRPDYPLAALLLAQLGPEGRQEAVAALQKTLARDPKARDSRVALAQIYLADNQLDAAQKEFEAMRNADPSDVTPLMALALIQIQQKNYDAARPYLLEFLQAANRQGATGNIDTGEAYLDLSQIELARKDEAAAVQWLDKIPRNSSQYIPGRIARAQLLTKAGRIEEARRMIAGVSVRDARDAALLARTDAAILMEAKRYGEAETALAEADKSFADDPDIIYEYAMAAEKNRHYTVMETQLHRLITLQPASPQAYNALGYSLADRNQRLDEADKLIEKAVALSPADPFIMDSLGWVKYRLGSKQDAVNILQKAFKLQPNAEIGAHLGEVQWSLGQHDQAKETWRAAQKLEPDNGTLVQTLKRFQVTDL